MLVDVERLVNTILRNAVPGLIVSSDTNKTDNLNPFTTQFVYTAAAQGDSGWEPPLKQVWSVDVVCTGPGRDAMRTLAQQCYTALHESPGIAGIGSLIRVEDVQLPVRAMSTSNPQSIASYVWGATYNLHVEYI